jgi:hypothetical protein
VSRPNGGLCSVVVVVDVVVGSPGLLNFCACLICGDPSIVADGESPSENPAVEIGKNQPPRTVARPLEHAPE